MLTKAQIEELEALGATTVRMRVAIQYGGHTGPESLIGGFRCGDIRRGDIDDWLVQKNREEMTQQSKTLNWARIAGWASIIGVVITTLGILWPKLFAP